jgi:hypothetical protein
VSTSESTSGESFQEAETYEVLQDHDVDDAPPACRPIAPGDVFLEVSPTHLAEPVVGPVMVVGHPGSLRRGLELQADVPVAPIVEPSIPTARHAVADRLLPVRKLIPPVSQVNRVVQLTRTTTVPARQLAVEHRCAALNNAGIVALQQRVAGNQIRVRVPAGMIAAHCRGALTELELWTDWRVACVEAGRDAGTHDIEFDEFMRRDPGFRPNDVAECDQ